jgi:hypothetical protein
MATVSALVTLTWTQVPTAIPNAKQFTKYQCVVKDAGGVVVAGPANEPLTSTLHVFSALTLTTGASYTAQVVLQKDDGTLDTNVASATFVGPAPATAPVPTALTVALQF